MIGKSEILPGDIEMPIPLKMPPRTIFNFRVAWVNSGISHDAMEQGQIPKTLSVVLEIEDYDLKPRTINIRIDDFVLTEIEKFVMARLGMNG